MTTNIGKILAGASLLAVMAVTPVMAADHSSPGHAQSMQPAGTAEVKTNPRGPEVTKEEIKEGWNDTKEAVSEKYEDVKAVLLGGNQSGTKFERVTYNGGYTAKGLIGHKVKDAQGNDVATIHDIILDKNGAANAIILSDGGFFGIGGKKVALDYSSVVKSTASSEILMPVSKDLVKRVAEFSYDNTAAAKGVRLIPSEGISVLDVLGAHVVDPAQKSVADVDNVILSKGHVSKMLIGFDKTLGLGGEQAALDFNDAKLIRNKDGKLDFQLSQKQSASFENYKKSADKTN